MLLGRNKDPGTPHGAAARAALQPLWPPSDEEGSEGDTQSSGSTSAAATDEREGGALGSHEQSDRDADVEEFSTPHGSTVAHAAPWDSHAGSEAAATSPIAEPPHTGSSAELAQAPAQHAPESPEPSRTHALWQMPPPSPFDPDTDRGSADHPFRPEAPQQGQQGTSRDSTRAADEPNGQSQEVAEGSEQSDGSHDPISDEYRTASSAEVRRAVASVASAPARLPQQEDEDAS